MSVVTGPVGARLDCGVVELHGADVRRFANGMFTNNVRDLPVGAVQRTAMVDDRGRVLGLLDLGCVAAPSGEERLVAVLEGVDPEAFVERYDAFVFVDDVTFVDRSSELAVHTVQGPGAAAALATVGLPTPSQGTLVEVDGGYVLWRDRTGGGGFDLVLPDGRALPEVLQDPDRIERLRVTAGLPRWPVDFVGKVLPHEMRMRDAFLSFEKGCYVGQEAIHRIDVQGQVRRRLMGVALEVPVESGAEVHHGGKVVGRLTSPVATADGVFGLAVLREAAATPGTEVEVVDGERRHRAVVRDLPA